MIEVFRLSYGPVQRYLAIEKLVVREGSEGQEKYYRVRPGIRSGDLERRVMISLLL